MADQTVRVEDNSRERVALDLMKFVMQTAEDEKGWTSKNDILFLYQDCMSATYRTFKG